VRRPDVRIGAVGAVALAVAFVVWLLVHDEDSNSSTSGPTQTVEAIAPVAASRDRLRALSAGVGRPIYWAGVRAGDTYELTRSAQDRPFAAPNGRIAVYDTAHPTNVYLARPGSDVQIEIFDPPPWDARGR
jgi:hypothetical protein